MALMLLIRIIKKRKYYLPTRYVISISSKTIKTNIENFDYYSFDYYSFDNT